MGIGKRMVGLWTCLFLLTLPAVAAADDSWSKVQQRGELIVGFCAQYPPFESKNEKTAEFEGFDVDLGKAVARQMGVKVKFVDAEWQGLLAGLKKGDYDVLITCMSKSEARNENVNMSDVYYTLPDVIVVRQDESVIRDRDGLKGKIVGVQLGSGSEQLADKNRELFKEIKRYNYNPEAFTDLKHKRIDAVIVGYAYAVNQIKTDPSYKVVGKPLAEADIVIVAARGADALTARINQSLSAVRTEGTYQKILDQWLKVD
ncbi:ABC transporter substrate-binding protein [Syntrophobacter fumaroxidans]|uniref:Extracellular solute-binding protein, family 3 n=1 Tax=Syntrophobacter fumaroxidans (strain DSM 10017 / MPOB) TaxID=335543 RepID=A0LQB7_SYNFM|nr:ABC transporter substrate-binding protein [Syntrophobacter fumaroxidans]ABK19619.1 extracellular solute-binding protein, family 3 [Syntrophobacter fumaroxidans MPOB]